MPLSLFLFRQLKIALLCLLGLAPLYLLQAQKKALYKPIPSHVAKSPKLYATPSEARQTLEKGVYLLTLKDKQSNTTKAIEQLPQSDKVRLFAYYPDNAYQHWVIVPNKNRTYSISNFESGHCLSYDTDKAKLSIAPCEGKPAQQWYIKGSKGNFELQNAQTKQYLSLAAVPYQQSVESSEYVGIQVQKRRGENSTSAKLVMLNPDDKGNNPKPAQFDLPLQPCDIAINAVAIDPEKNIFIGKLQKQAFIDAIKYIDPSRIKNIKIADEPIKTTPTDGIKDPASDQEREVLLQQIKKTRALLQQNKGNIHYYIATKGLLENDGTGSIFINEISRPALAELSKELNALLPLIKQPKLDKSQYEAVIIISRNILAILENPYQTRITMLYYASNIARTLKLSAIDAKGNSVPNVRFYLMSPQNFNTFAEFVCHYFICEASTLQTYAIAHTSTGSYIKNAYYHVFAVQSRNGVDTIIGYNILTPNIQQLAIVTE
jgi:hypothetical protein